MLKSLVAAAAMLLAGSSLVAAQDRLSPGGGAGVGDGSRDRVIEQPYAVREDARRGPDGRDRPGPPPPREPGFRLDLGGGRSLDVTCGASDLRACVAASRTLVDALTAAPSSASPAPEPLVLPAPLAGPSLSSPPPDFETTPPAPSAGGSARSAPPPSPSGNAEPPPPPQPAG